MQAPCPAVAGQHKMNSGILPDFLSHIVWVRFCLNWFFCLHILVSVCIFAGIRVCVFLGYFVCFLIIVLKRESEECGLGG